MKKQADLLEALLKKDFKDREFIDSYVKLVKELSDAESFSPDTILDKLNISEFVEDTETTYKSFPIKIVYKQLPVIVNGDVLVKVVVLIQADSYAIIIPEHISETFKDLLENPDLINDKNIDLSLYAEVYNFDSNDRELLDLIKEAYLSAGNSLKAFELTGDLKKEEDELEGQSEEQTSEQPQVPSFGSDFDKPSMTPAADFGEIDSSIEEAPEVQENSKPFSRFKKQGSYLENLTHKLYSISNDIFKENTKIRFLGEKKNILLVEVNNKEIYKKYSRVPAVAKKSLSVFGESIRNGKMTQLLDTFTIDGKKYFAIAECAGNNFWYVSKEKIGDIIDSTDIIKPIQKDIIRLKKSSVRQESRKFVPKKDNKEIIFQKITK